MKFDSAGFLRFCRELRVETKERGIIRLGENMLGTQKYLIEEITRGLEQDQHYFVILKGRQLGITTFSLALDLYWQFVHPGFSGTLVTDTEENRNMFKSTLEMYMDGLPPRFRIPLVAHNRTQLVLKNRSRLLYQVAGTRNNGGLGRGKAITYLHGTETSSWGSPEGLASLVSSLAETNPLRLFLFESTARGFDMFHDMYKTALASKSQRAVFIGWWRNELYALQKGSDLYKAYWDGRLKPDEREWVREIKKLYGVEISSMQIAWWRWKLAEIVMDEGLMMQEFPPVPELAFISSGSNFFSTSRCTAAMTRALIEKPQLYRFDFGQTFMDTQLIAGNPRTVELKIWQEPVAGAWYVIGADPAYGSSDWADRFVIQVFRAYADGLDQVAEYCTSDINPYQFAWVLSYLAGAYPNATLNLEVNGPGQSVLTEMRNLRRQAMSIPDGSGEGIFNVLSNMKNYLWRRTDSMSGPGMSIGWVTTASTKERMMTYLKDYFERGMMNIFSDECIDEMKSIMRDGASIQAAGRNKDDRVIASALACAAFAEQVQPAMIMQRLTRERMNTVVDASAMTHAAQRSIQRWMGAIGMKS